MSAPIGAVGQLVSVIRAQLSSRSEFSTANKNSSANRSANKPNAYSSESLETLVKSRIKSIEKDDPNRGRKAFRVFLEAILLTQLGEHLINDPEFYRLVDQIQASMEAVPDVLKLVEKATGHLLSSSELQ